MALGRKVIVWDEKDMLRGMSTSDDTSDGGFSPLTDQINLRYLPGVGYMPTAPTDKSTNATGEMIASCEDESGSYTRLFLSADSSQDGQFYSVDSSGTLTARGSEDTTNNYIAGRTDFIGYKGEAYATSAETIIRWSGIGGANTFNTTFHSFNDTFAPHPAIVFEDNAYFGDGNELLRMTSAGGTPAIILSLPSGWVITALGIDPGSGKMLIGIVNQYNISDTVNSQARVGFYDGFSNKLIRAVLMDDMVTAFPTSEGTQYIAYGQNLGYWNGSGATFIRRFEVDFDNTELFYKHHFTGIGPTLFFIVKRQIIAHGPIQQGGQRVFYPLYKNYVNTNDLSLVTYLGTLASATAQGLAFSFATSKFYTLDINSKSSGGTMDFYSNEYDINFFNDGMILRRVVIIWKDTVSNNVDPGSIRFLNQDGSVTTIGQSGLFDLRNTSGAASAIKVVDCGGDLGTLFYTFQFNLILDTVNPGIRRILVYADPANTP